MVENQNSHCPICNSIETKSVLNWGEYSINNCKQCNLVYGNPLPTETFLEKFYQGFLFNKPNKSEVRRIVEKRKVELNKLFNFQGEDKKFLDYGGGTGSAYKAACELRLNSYYHDLDKEAEAFVKQEHGLTNEFIIKDMKSTTLTFDYILSDNVIEHLIDPVNYVREMGAVLKPGGEIIIKTPHGRNTESFFYPIVILNGYFLKSLKFNSIGKSIKSFFWRFWSCDPPRHIYSFSHVNLRMIAENAGFDASEVIIDYYNIPLFKYSFLSMFLDRSKYGSLKAVFMRVLSIPILPFELATKVLQYCLLSIRVLSPGGIILKIKKN